MLFGYSVNNGVSVLGFVTDGLVFCSVGGKYYTYVVWFEQRKRTRWAALKQLEHSFVSCILHFI